MRKLTYSEKLRDPMWLRRKADLIEGVKCCELCLTENIPLEPHHRYYKSGTEPWDYPDHAFQVVCRGCHKILQGIMETAHEQIAIHQLEISLSKLAEMSDAETAWAQSFFDTLYLRPELRASILEKVHHLLTTPHDNA